MKKSLSFRPIVLPLAVSTISGLITFSLQTSASGVRFAPMAYVITCNGILTAPRKGN